MSRDNDKRFTFGLTQDVIAVLRRHGYPVPVEGPGAGMAHVATQQALFRLLYTEMFPEPEESAPTGRRNAGKGE